MLRLEIYRVPPETATAVLRGDLALDTVDDQVGPYSRSAFAPAARPSPKVLELGGHWDCLWYLLSPERRARSISWSGEMASPLSWSVAGRHRSGLDLHGRPADRDQEPLDELRFNGPEDVREAARALRHIPLPVSAVNPDAVRQVGVYHGRNCPGGTHGLPAEVFTRALGSLADFYREAADAGEGTLHSVG